MKYRTHLCVWSTAAALAVAAAPASAQDSFDQAQGQGSAQGQPMSPYPQQPPQGNPQQGYPPQAYPQQPGAQPMPPQGYPQQPTPQAYPLPGGGASLDQLMQMERQDFGVAPTSSLHSGAMHGPTPASIPGGQVITTKGLLELVQGGQVPALILDVLGGPEIIQGAQYAIPAAQPGSFEDQPQQQFAQFLQQATRGNKQHPIVLYCQSPQCWLSYNASLRAIKLGYTNVLWYRGGIEAWKQAGLPVQSAQAYPPQR